MPAGCVQAFPLKHRVPCCGYAFTLPRAGKFDPQRAKAAGIPVSYWSTLQSGQPVGGFLPSQVLGPPRRGLKVVYATDTRPCAALRRAAQDADLLLMDSTYADDADLPAAYENGPHDAKAREQMATASTMAGMAFANAFLGVCHSMAHKLGAFHHLPHGIANAILITDVMRFNAAEVPANRFWSRDGASFLPKM